MNIYSITFKDDSHHLEHHGVQGQKWGERHGPPYPLDSRYSTGKSLRERYIKKRELVRNEINKRKSENPSETKNLKSMEKRVRSAAEAEYYKDKTIKDVLKFAGKTTATTLGGAAAGAGIGVASKSIGFDDQTATAIANVSAFTLAFASTLAVDSKIHEEIDRIATDMLYDELKLAKTMSEGERVMTKALEEADKIIDEREKQTPN